jgi:hypothetical protein
MTTGDNANGICGRTDRVHRCGTRADDVSGLMREVGEILIDGDDDERQRLVDIVLALLADRDDVIGIIEGTMKASKSLRQREPIVSQRMEVFALDLLDKSLRQFVACGASDRTTEGLPHGPQTSEQS